DALRLGHRILAVAPRAREVEIVNGAQVVYSRLPRRIESFVGAVHVAELRVTTHPRDAPAVDDRRLAGHALPRAVGMPRERSPIGMLAVGLPVCVEVGQAIELGKPVGVI